MRNGHRVATMAVVLVGVAGFEPTTFPPGRDALPGYILIDITQVVPYGSRPRIKSGAGSGEKGRGN